jgi:ERCC4-type nuclease
MNNTFELIIDNRERKLIDLLNTCNIQFTVQQLDLGDIVYQKNGTDYIIIERKTIPDLVSSIRDSRAREQKRRLMDLKKTIPHIKIMYLIEGIIKENKYTNKSTIFSSIVNTMIRDDLYLFRTINLDETKEFIIKIYNQLHTYKTIITPDYENLNQIDVEYASLTHRKKKHNITPSVCYINQLAQIPGVSDTIATTIVDNYPSIMYLIQCYLNADSELDKENLLADVMIISNNKQRRIGHILSKKIYEYLCNGY